MQVPGRCYIVGGAVRDALLGRTPGDRDWVVVGSTPQAMLAAGFRPVGRDFPVFLHPQTHEEYALARTERKSAPGYHGFTFHAAPEVTLEQDLARRDLTINAIAQATDGPLIDPFGGQQDLRAGVLRHVSAAFAEDPVRLLRLARLAARFPDFSVAPETALLLRHLVEDGEVDALVPERVWQELSRGLMETKPGRMLQVLHDCGALERLLPGVDAGAQRLGALDACARAGAPLTVRFACLALRLAGADADTLSARLRVPADCRELALVMAREHAAVHGSAGLDPETTLQLLERCDALRRPARFAELLDACACDARSLAGPHDAEYLPRRRLAAALEQAMAVDTAAVSAAAAARGLAGPAIGTAVRQARVAALDAKAEGERRQGR
ncbi:MAG TPA: multifunctional CCA tRNA nucleotidyl transferase/2'3'-cyclic phosphodiesterase/2'nucleotidase/phosphatase [Rubrivivax sp.]